jgi:phage terminase large subunit-like protein
MVEHPQTNARMCPPTTATYELVVTGRLMHDGDPALARHVAAAVEVTTLEGKTRFGKGSDRRGRRRRNDGAIALLMAVGSALGHEVAEEDEPIIIVIDEAA